MRGHDGRHYVTLGKHRWRNFLVVRTNVALAPTPGRGRLSVKYTYTTISRHWTWKGANKVCHRLNAREGHSQ